LCLSLNILDIHANDTKNRIPLNRIICEKPSTSVERFTSGGEVHRIPLRKIYIIYDKVYPLIIPSYLAFTLSKFNHFINKSYFSSSNKVPLNAEALEQMKQSTKLLGIHSEYVFPNTDGTCLTACRLIRSLNHLAKLANVTYLGVHSLRHSFASALIKKGVSIKVVSEILGHSDAYFTANVYVHIDTDQKLEAVNSI